MTGASASRFETLLEARNIKQYFPIATGFFSTTLLKAVDDVSFTVGKGETLGLVGESGCGKTTVGRSLLHLYPLTGGEVYFDNIKITKNTLNAFRRRAQMVFQDPYSSLNPRMTVGDIIAEPLDVHGLCGHKSDSANRVNELLNIVGLSSEQATRYAHEFSGGQRQRIGIARALASNPEFIVCDEPVSALDVSIQAQIINVLEDLQRQFNLAYLFIAHDLSVVKHISHRIAVMYLGVIVELTSSGELHKHPLHPYTQSLLSAVPIPDPEKARKAKRIILSGDVPSPLRVPSGCPFRTRCAHAMDICAEIKPNFHEADPGHFVACHLIK